VGTIHSSVASEPDGEGKISLINIFGESAAFKGKGDKENKKRIKIVQNFIGLAPYHSNCGTGLTKSK